VASRPCVYVNTSVVIRALNPGEPGYREAQRILEECCKRCRCVWSTVHGYEGFRSDIARLFFYGYLASLGAEYREVDIDDVLAKAERYKAERGLSDRRLLDVEHMVAASGLGCKYILARDRFISRHANNFGLTYVNWETHGGRCPCGAQTGRREFRASGSGAGEGTRRASYTLSSRKRRGTAASGRRPGKSLRSGRKRGSPSKRPGRGSRGSRQRPRARKASGRRRRRGGV